MAERILIVDDEPEAGTLIGLMLSQQGFDVLTASSGREALVKSAECTPDLILLDVMMPGMDGYEVCRQLRADPHLSHIPVIFLTAKTEVSDRIAGFEAGGDEFMSKPIHQGELIARVNALLNRTAAMRAALARPAYVVAILGAKGGLGTTTLAVNVAVSCVSASGGVRTILAEMCHGRGAASLMLSMPRMEGIAVLLRCSPEQIDSRLVENRLAAHSSGLRLLLTPSVLDENAPNWTPELAEAILRHLRRMADMVFLDLGVGLTAVNRRLINMADHLILTLDPNPLTLAITQETMEALQSVAGGANHLDLVMINRSPSSLTLPFQTVEDSLHWPVSQVITPAPEPMFQAIQRGLPLVLSDRNNLVSGQYQELAQKIMAHLPRLAGTALPADDRVVPPGRLL